MKNFELNWILNSPAFSRTNSYARELRGHSTAGWMESMLERIVNQGSSVEDVKASTSATAGHSVESFVDELRKRVGLDSLSKTAADNPDFKAYDPHNHDNDPQNQSKSVKDRFFTLAAAVKDLLAGKSLDGPPSEGPSEEKPKMAELPLHVRTTASQILNLVSSSWESNTHVNELRDRLDTTGEGFAKAIQDLQKNRGNGGAGEPTMTPEENFIADVLFEVSHGLEVLARTAKQDAMPGIPDTAPKTSAAKIPLSKTSDEEKADPKKTLAEMGQYLKTYHLRPTHAMKEPEALFFELKNKFGIDVVQELGRDSIMELIEKLREEMKEPSMSENLPKYDGSPMQLREEPENQGQQKQQG